MPVACLISFVALFGALLQVHSSSDVSEQKSVSTLDHYMDMDMINSGAASSFIAADMDANTDGKLDVEMMTSKRKSALRRIETLVDYKDNGQAVVSTVNKNDLVAMSAAITDETYKKQLSDLVDAADGSRYIKSEGNSKAAEYIKTRFQGMGYEVYEIPWEKSIKPSGVKNNIASIVAFKKGTDLNGEAFILGAHFDSVNWRDTSKTAPGVDDNGSGVAGLMSIGESMKGHTPRRNVLLVAFNAEEEGLLGSKSFVQTVVTNNQYPQFGNIKGALIMDEIAFPGRDKYANQAIFETVGSVAGSQTLVDTLAHNTEDSMGAIKSNKVNWNGFGSDHISTSNVNIPSLLLIERDDEYHADKVGHSEQDTFSGLSMTYGASMARLSLRAYTSFLNPRVGTSVIQQDTKKAGNLRFTQKLDPTVQKKAMLQQKYSEA